MVYNIIRHGKWKVGCMIVTSFPHICEGHKGRQGPTSQQGNCPRTLDLLQSRPPSPYLLSAELGLDSRLQKDMQQTKPVTLLVQDFRQQKNQPLPIQRSRPSRDSQEPKTTKKIQFSRWLFQKIPFLYFFLHKS